MLYNKKQYRYYPATGFYIKAISVILLCAATASKK
jgi:hypothetical protein